jgi:hypothetical protein
MRRKKEKKQASNILLQVTCILMLNDPVFEERTDASLK